MTHPPSAPSAVPKDERRQHLRISFSPVQRPRLFVGGGAYEVLDASLGGLRIRHTDPRRPAVGARISGSLQWPPEDTPVPLVATIVRVLATELALECERGAFPIGHLLSESARRRDLTERGGAVPEA